MAAEARRLTPRARRLRTRMLRIECVVESPGIFSDEDAFWVNGREIAYFDGDTLGLRLTRKVIGEQRATLKGDARVRRRGKSSDWVEVSIGSAADVTFALALVELAAAAYRPPAGVPLRPPPVGPELEKRRRFH